MPTAFTPFSSRRPLIQGLLALLLGVAHAFTFAPWGNGWLQLAVLTGFALLVLRGGGFLTGLLFGIGWFSAGVGWVYISMHDYGGVPAPLAAVAVVLFSSYLGLYPALGALFCRRNHLAPWPFVLTFSGALTLAELARGWVLTGFPWLGIGYAQIDSPLAGFAPVGGVYLVTLVTSFIAASAAVPLQHVLTRHTPAPTPPILPLMVLCLVSVALLGLGTVLGKHAWSIPAGKPLSVSLLQGNVPQAMKFDPETAALARHQYLQMIENAPADLILLPETAWTTRWDNTESSLKQRLYQFIFDTDSTVALGLPRFGLVRVPGTHKPGTAQNAANTANTANTASTTNTTNAHAHAHASGKRASEEQAEEPASGEQISGERASGEHASGKDMEASVAKAADTHAQDAWQWQVSNSVEVFTRESILGPSAAGSIDRSGRYHYDKRHLVPFGEFIPEGFHWFMAIMQVPLGDQMRGSPQQPLLDLKDQRIGFDICYEDIFGEELLDQVRDQHPASPSAQQAPGHEHPERTTPDREHTGRDTAAASTAGDASGTGATILANLTNLGWFGNSHALPQHLQIARMRALETARPIIRATNTGTTAVIDAHGHVQAQLPTHQEGTLRATVQGHTGLTPYARLGGNLALWLLSAALMAAGTLLARKFRAAPASGADR